MSDPARERQDQCIKISCRQQKLHFKTRNDQIIALEVNGNSVDGVVATVATISTVKSTEQGSGIGVAEVS